MHVVHLEKTFYIPGMEETVMGATEARQQLDYDVGDDALYNTRSPSSARRYRQPAQHDTVNDPALHNGPSISRRRASMTTKGTDNSNSNGIATKAAPFPSAEIRGRRISLLAVLIGMLVMALLAVGLTAFGSWWRVHMDDMQYGRPRTFQLDAVVGHGGDSPSNPTHFIFINLNRHIEIIELPAGDATNARIYPGPVLYGDGQDLTPVTAEIRDVNGDGKPDIIVHIQDQQLVLINDGTQFRPLRQGEQINLNH
jgi:hypothetical protein